MFDMQRVFLLLSTLFALYACTTTVPHAPVEEKPATLVVHVEEPASATGIIETPAPETVVIETPAPVLTLNIDAVPHIALLLPLQSRDYGSAADAVQQGFLAAARRQSPVLPIRVYSDFDENNSVVNVYRGATASGSEGGGGAADAQRGEHAGGRTIYSGAYPDLEY